jgi:hypothetical protein
MIDHSGRPSGHLSLLALIASSVDASHRVNGSQVLHACMFVGSNKDSFFLHHVHAIISHHRLRIPTWHRCICKLLCHTPLWCLNLISILVMQYYFHGLLSSFFTLCPPLAPLLYKSWAPSGVDSPVSRSVDTYTPQLSQSSSHLKGHHARRRRRMILGCDFNYSIKPYHSRNPVWNLLSTPLH